MTTEQDQIHNMKDHDLLVRIAVKVDALEEHSSDQNGHIENLTVRALKMEGALDFGRWVLGVTLAVMTLGLGVTGLVLANVM